MDMNGQWPVSPWDFASGRSRSYSQSARSPILHRSPLTSQCVPWWWMPHVNRDTVLYSQPCQESNMPKTVLCQVQYIAQRLFAPFPLLIEWGFLKSFNTGRDHTNYAVSLSAMASWIWKACRSSLRVGAMHQVARLVRFSQPRAHVSLFSPPLPLIRIPQKGPRANSFGPLKTTHFLACLDMTTLSWANS